mgnify:CR=1 FL=1
MNTQHTHTIQVWPSGTSYEYTGDPFSGAPWRTRPSGERDERANPWSDAHCLGGRWVEIRTELRAQRIQDRDIFKNDSLLVGDMLGASADLPEHFFEEWEIGNVNNLYPDPSEWDSERCGDWLSDHGIDWIGSGKHVSSTASLDADELRELVNDHAEPVEIYEWWAVTDWLAQKLNAINEPVLSNAYGHWWGRTCSGQAMIMDGTLQQIAAAIEAA